jgi:hypothetical protein
LEIAVRTHAAWVLVGALTVSAVILPQALLARPLASPSVRIQDCGSVSAIAIGDGYAYAGTGSRLTIFDISDPAAPVAVSRSEELPGKILDIGVAGPFAALALGDAGLAIVDISDAPQPHVTSLAAYRPVYRLLAAGARIYTVGDPYPNRYPGPWERALSTFEISDLSDPGDPLVARFVTPLDGYGFALAAAGGRVYVNGYQPFLSVFDVTTPDAPRPVRTSEFGRAFGHAIAATEDGHVYFATQFGGNAELLVFATADDAEPQLLFRDSPFVLPILPTITLTPTLPPTPSVRIIRQSSGLRTIEALLFTTAGHLAELASLFGPEGGEVLRILDVSDPSRPTQVGRYQTARPAPATGTPPQRWVMATAGSYVYIAEVEQGLQVVNISDPTAPALVWSNRCL